MATQKPIVLASGLLSQIPTADTLLFPNGAAATPGCAFNGATTTGLFLPDSDSMSFTVKGVETGRFVTTPTYPAQALLLGSTTFVQTIFAGVTVNPYLQVSSTGAAAALGFARFSANGNDARLFFIKSRGVTVGAQAALNPGDALGTLSFGGSDGTAIVEAADYRVMLSAASSAGSLTADHVWYTANASSTPAERLRLTAPGALQMGGANTVIDENRILRPLSGTVGTAVTPTPTGLEMFSDEGGSSELMFSDGSFWRSVQDRQVGTASIGSRGVLGRFTARAGITYQNVVHQTYSLLSAAGLLTKLTGLWVYAVPTNQTDALGNWITPGTRVQTVTGSPVFTANRGDTGDGATALLRTGTSLTGFGAALDNTSIGAYVLTASAASAGIFGTNTGNRRLYLTSASSGTLTARCNDATDDTFTPARYTGMFTLSRVGSTGYKAYLDDQIAATIVRASSTVSIGGVEYLGTNDGTGNEFSTAQLAFAFIGTGLTDADVANLRGIMVDYYLVQIGAVTPTVSNLPPAANFQGQVYYIPNLGGGAGLIQSDGVNWFRTSDGYEARSLATGSETLTYLTNASYVLYNQTLTGNVTVTLSGVDAKGTVVKKGARFTVTHNAAVPGLFTFAIANGGGGGGTLTTFPSATAKSATCVFDGTNWVLMQDSII